MNQDIEEFFGMLEARSGKDYATFVSAMAFLIQHSALYYEDDDEGKGMTKGFANYAIQGYAEASKIDPMIIARDIKEIWRLKGDHDGS